jgi:hypothetical protein
MVNSCAHVTASCVKSTFALCTGATSISIHKLKTYRPQQSKHARTITLLLHFTMHIFVLQCLYLFSILWNFEVWFWTWMTFFIRILCMVTYPLWCCFSTKCLIVMYTFFRMAVHE